MDKRELPIGFMDSGVGGISVLKSTIELLPHEDFLYYGDSLHAPYGTKGVDEIKQLTFNVVDYLLSKGIKVLVVACNTATSAAINDLRNKYPNMPIVGIEPAIKPAVMANQGGRIIVMATPMTIKQDKFRHLLSQYNEQAEIVPLGCDHLMEFVEEGILSGEKLKAYFDEHLKPYITDNTETIVLGCTHYPFLYPYLKKYLHNDHIHIIDGSYGTAMELKRRLEAEDLLNENQQGNIIIENSLESQDIIDLSWKLLCKPTYEKC
ncbi:MAG: glutamate racemase [Erysipelotrichaceae bacterium]|nr:glutamate racemase [Erysipelotrichaceae bacterium]